MSNYITAYAVKMDSIAAVLSSEKVNLQKAEELYNQFLLQIASDSYAKFLMGLEEGEEEKEQIMKTTFLNFLQGTFDEEEEHSKYGYLYLVFCRLHGKKISGDADIPFSSSEIEDTFSHYNIDIDASKIVYRYDEGLPFKEPSGNAMWPLMGYYKLAELEPMLKKISKKAEYGLVIHFKNWIKEAMKAQTDLVLFWF